MVVQKDLELLGRTLNSCNLQSRRYERNIENAVRRCLNRGQARRSVLNFWAEAFDVSLETFVLLACTFGHDSLTRRTNGFPQLLSRLKEEESQARIRCHRVLLKWANCLRKQGGVSRVISKGRWLMRLKGSIFLVTH